MNKEALQKLARSLTAEDIHVIPYLPYLLQDLWKLGSSSDDVLQLFETFIPESENMNVLDLACGKGAVSIPLAKRYNCEIRGVDIVPEFIEYANKKAAEEGVEKRCRFFVEDIIETVQLERDWDCVMLLGVGDILGNWDETLLKLSATIRHGGYIFIEGVYVPEEEWVRIIQSNGLAFIGRVDVNPDFLLEENDYCNHAIRQRAEELIERYPDKEDLFRKYIQSQRNECAELGDSRGMATFLIQKETII